MKTKTIYILLALLASSFSIKAQHNNADFDVSEETKNSILLTFETINVLDSISEMLWPGWNAEKLSYYLGAVGENQILINPYFIVPEEFKKHETLSSDRNSVYIREKNEGRKQFGSTSFVKLGEKIYSVSATHFFPFNWPEEALFTAKTAKAFDSFTELYHRTMINLYHSPEFFVAIQIHEGFHVFQRPKIQKMRMKTIDPDYYFKPKVMVYSYIEGVLLLNALQTNNAEDLLRIVHEFISVRMEKYKYISKRKQKAEQEDEFVEGTAQYVQTMSQIILKELNYESQTFSLHKLNCDFNKANDFQLIDSVKFISSIRQYDIDEFWNKCYFYGQTQAFILDKLCGNIWKSEVMKGETLLWDLIIKYSNYTESNKVEIKDIKSEFEYDKLLKTVRKMDKKSDNNILK